jgi:hypothetical protein
LESERLQAQPLEKSRLKLLEQAKKVLNPPKMKPLRSINMKDPLKSFLHPSVMQQVPRTPKQLPFVPLELPGGSNPLSSPFELEELNLDTISFIPVPATLEELNRDAVLANPLLDLPHLPFEEPEPQFFDQIESTPVGSSLPLILATNPIELSDPSLVELPKSDLLMFRELVNASPPNPPELTMSPQLLPPAPQIKITKPLPKISLTYKLLATKPELASVDDFTFPEEVYESPVPVYNPSHITPVPVYNPNHVPPVAAFNHQPQKYSPFVHPNYQLPALTQPFTVHSQQQLEPFPLHSQ